MQDWKNEIHIVPVFKDEETHEETRNCFCSPKLIYKDNVTKKEVWSHNRIKEVLQ